MSRVLAINEQSTETEKKTIYVKSGFETFRLDTTVILFLEKDGN